MLVQGLAQALECEPEPRRVIELQALLLQLLQFSHHEVWRFQTQHQGAVVLAAVVAGREIGNAGCAVEVDREVELPSPRGVVRAIC
jgi:hypothetical protein